MRVLDVAPQGFMGLTLLGSASLLVGMQVLLPGLMPYALAVMALVGAGMASVSLLKMIRLAKGAQAEAHVGKFLQTLERRGAYVLHDICRNGFNIDHVVVATSGVYVIETKYVSKLGHGRDEIACRGGVLYRNRRPMRGDALGQVTRATEEVGRMTKALGYAPFLRSVLVYPGWWTKSEGAVWVVNEKAVLKWIRRAPAVMTPDEVRRLYLALRAPAAEEAVAA